MKRVQISALKSQLSKHLRAAEAGEIIEVMDRARAIARVVPVEATAELELVPPERPFTTVRRVKLPRIMLRVSSLEALADERGLR
ncbi:MAG: Antitoxin [Myxococcales bacterium]|nr:Antitoxin [Myxococcales bacterium]